MAVFRPDRTFLDEQIRSLAAQDVSDTLTVFVIADCDSAALVKTLARGAGLRHHIVVPPDMLDSPRAFEFGLKAALDLSGPETLFALCDQDDVWHKDRLSKGIEALRRSGADLAHSDARLIEMDGTLRHPSMFAFEGRHRRPGSRTLLYRNSITGMTTLMRRRLVEIALPFPAQSAVHYYHDLWLALLAEATGGIVLIPEATVDYRQHRANAVGAVDRRAPVRFRPFDGVWLRQEAGAYALARYLAKSVVLRMHEAIEAGLVPADQARLTPLKAYLHRLHGTEKHGADAVRLALGGHLRLSAIALNHAVISSGRVVWSLRHALGHGLTAAVGQFDERLFSLSPGVQPMNARPVVVEPTGASYATIIDRRKHAPWKPDFTATAPALVILVPTLNPTEMFAGIVTALDIGLGLAARGQRVRFVATDLPVAARQASFEFLRNRAKAGAEANFEIHCGVTSARIALHRDDVFLATAWWTAHVAQTMIAEAGFRRREFLYLIQDYEPNFYPWGSEFADAVASYGFAFRPIFNTTLLRDYFATLGYGFASPDAPAFAPAIDVGRYARIPRMAAARPRRIAVYGRPEVPRNLFPMAIEVLARFIEDEGLRPSEVEIVSVGMKHGPIALPNGIVMKSLGKLAWEAYPGYLAGVDLGLSLMLSPHPSHPPIEMAAAGARVVTNRFATKDLGQLSPAILSVAPAVPDLVAAMQRTWRAAPVSQAEREFDLAALGEPIEVVIDRIAASLVPATAGRRKAAVKAG